MRGSDGELVFNASHICVNGFSIPFLRKNALMPLPYLYYSSSLNTAGSISLLRK